MSDSRSNAIDLKGKAIRLRAVEAAAYLGVSRSTLSKWRAHGEGPPFHRLGRRLTYYSKHELDEWLHYCDEVNRQKLISKGQLTRLGGLL